MYIFRILYPLSCITLAQKVGVPIGVFEDTAHARVRGDGCAEPGIWQWDYLEHVSQALLEGAHKPESVHQLCMEYRGKGDNIRAAEGLLNTTE